MTSPVSTGLILPASFNRVLQMLKGSEYPYATIEIVCIHPGGGQHIKLSYHDGPGAPLVRYRPLMAGTFYIYCHQNLLRLTVGEWEGQLVATGLFNHYTGQKVAVR